MEAIINKELYDALCVIKNHCEEHPNCKDCVFASYRGKPENRIVTCMFSKKIPAYYGVSVNYILNTGE